MGNLKYVLFLYVLWGFSLQAQVNFEDSSFTATVYWDKKAKANYSVSNVEFTMKEQDTTQYLSIQYDVQIQVLDSNKDGYLVEWLYQNYRVFSGDQNTHDFLQKIYSQMPSQQKVQIKTDVHGAFVEIKNWKEIKSEIQKSFKLMRQNFEGVEVLEKMLKGMEQQYETKESIEAKAIDDIKQFAYFQGLKYTKGQPEKGLYKGADFWNAQGTIDRIYEFELLSIDSAGDAVMLKAIEKADPVQMQTAFKNFTRVLGEQMGASSEEVERQLKQDIQVQQQVTVANYMHESGWPLESFQTIELLIHNTYKYKEIFIEFQGH